MQSQREGWPRQLFVGRLDEAEVVELVILENLKVRTARAKTEAAVTGLKRISKPSPGATVTC